MKIVDLQTFRTLPQGTLFAKYQPCIFEELCVKGENCGQMDFDYHPLFDVVADSSDDQAETIMDASETGAEMTLDFESWIRDGMYDANQLFAVFSKEDTKGLVAMLTKSTSE